MNTLGAALAAVAQGWAVFPICARAKKPPLVKEWESRAVADPDLVRQHWRLRANVGIACGPSGLVVIDTDRPEPGETPPPAWAEPGVTDGLDALALLAERTGGDLGPALDTYTVWTPSGGCHLYYRAPEGPAIRNSASQIAWRVDVRGLGGYVVAAGSETPGGRYEAGAVTDVAPLPGWLLRVLTERPATQAPAEREPRRPAGRQRSGRADEDSRERYRWVALKNALSRLLETGEGGRNCALNSEAFGLVKAGWSPAELEPVLMDAAGRIGLPQAEARRTLASAFGGGGAA